MRLLLAFALSLAVAGCNIGPNTRVNTYTPFGQFQPGENDRVSQEYAASLASPAPDYDVTILKCPSSSIALIGMLNSLRVHSQ